MYRQISGTNERVRVIPGVRDRRVRATKVRLYQYSVMKKRHLLPMNEIDLKLNKFIYFLSVEIFRILKMLLDGYNIYLQNTLNIVPLNID